MIDQNLEWGCFQYPFPLEKTLALMMTRHVLGRFMRAPVCSTDLETKNTHSIISALDTTSRCHAARVLGGAKRDGRRCLCAASTSKSLTSAQINPSKTDTREPRLLFSPLLLSPAVSLARLPHRKISRPQSNTRTLYVPALWQRTHISSPAFPDAITVEYVGPASARHTGC